MMVTSASEEGSASGVADGRSSDEHDANSTVVIVQISALASFIKCFFIIVIVSVTFVSFWLQKYAFSARLTNFSPSFLTKM